jgi:hypothetical protein
MYPDNDIQKLKEKLMDYYGTAAASGMPMAVMELGRLENMTDEEIRREAEKNHIK